jgi:hypothetical protein
MPRSRQAAEVSLDLQRPGGEVRNHVDAARAPALGGRELTGEARLEVHQHGLGVLAGTEAVDLEVDGRRVELSSREVPDLDLVGHAAP